jgi:dipeptidyl aminopeptidase/acylaminoacyl peptidase
MPAEPESGGAYMKKIDRRGLLALAGATAAMTGIGRHANAQAGTAAPADAQASASIAPLGDPPSLEIFARTPLIDDITLSPDGKRVAFITQKGDQKVLGFFDIADKKIHSVALGAKKIRSLFWAGNTHVVLVDSQTDFVPQFGTRSEFYLAQIIDLDTLSLRQIFGNMDNFYNIVSGNLGVIRVGDQYRVTASGYRMTGEYDLCLYSFGLSKGDAAHQIDEGANNTEGWVLTPSGVPVAYSDFQDDASTHDKQWTLYYNTAGTTPPHYKKIYSVKGAKAYPDLVGLGRDGKSVVLSVKDPDDDGYNYHEMSADGVLSPPLDTKPGVRTPLFHPVTYCLAGFQTHNDWFTYDYFDPLMKKLAEAVPQVLAPGYRFSIVDTAEDPRKMIVYGESADDAGSYYFIDFSTGDSQVIAGNYPDLPEAWITQKQGIDYKTGDGLTVHAYLTLPPGKAPKDLPLVMLPHGGPAARDYIDFDWEAQAFASRGYAVLQPNFRGSTGYGLTFEDAGNGQWGRKMQSDLSDGIAHLAKQGIVDPKRVAIYGASYGGYAALAGATLDPAGTYRCAVDIAGVSDLRPFLSFIEESKGNDYTPIIVTNEKEMLGDPKHYDDISPARQAAKAYCPILIIHGTDDTVVPIDQSQRMERALKAAGKDVQFITYKGQTHWEDIASSRLAMIQSAMDFITKHNPA